MAKRGRKRKAGARHACGRIKQIKQDPRDTVIEARMRHHKLSKTAAKRQEAGDALGLAYMAGDLSNTQYDALVDYREAYENYQFALDQKRQRSASDFSGAGGFDSDDGSDPHYVERCERAKARYALYRRAALESGQLGHMAVKTWVLDDCVVKNLIGDLRLAANAIDRVKRMPKAA